MSIPPSLIRLGTPGAWRIENSRVGLWLCLPPECQNTQVWCLENYPAICSLLLKVGTTWSVKETFHCFCFYLVCFDCSYLSVTLCFVTVCQMPVLLVQVRTKQCFVFVQICLCKESLGEVLFPPNCSSLWGKQHIHVLSGDSSIIIHICEIGIK